MEDIRWSDYLNDDFYEENSAQFGDDKLGEAALRQSAVGDGGHEIHADNVFALDRPPKATNSAKDHPFIGVNTLSCFPRKCIPESENCEVRPEQYNSQITNSGKTPSGQLLNPDTPKKRSPHRAEINNIVRDWLKTHVEDPYPTTKEKEGFSQSWGLTLQQVSNLFNNERRRSQWNQNSSTVDLISNNQLPLTVSLFGAADSSKGASKGESPLDRYLSSSSDEDPQSKETVALAAASMREILPAKRKQDVSQPYGREDLGVPSKDNEVENASISDRSSTNSLSAQSTLSVTTSTSGKRGKRKRTTARRTESNKGRYYCIYCWSNFTSGSSWRKHEETVHRPQKQFECRMAEIQPSLQDCGACYSFGSPTCLVSLMHNYQGCRNRTKETRTFNRKDHFESHLKRNHQAKFTLSMNDWVLPSTENKRSRCGYCCKWFPTWTERQNHIADHCRYHDGFDRSKWQLEENDADDDRDVEVSTQLKVTERQEESSLILYGHQQDAELKIYSFLDLGRVPFFDGWQKDTMFLEFRGLKHSSTIIVDVDREVMSQGGSDSCHDVSCPASQGGRCKFDALSDLEVVFQMETCQNQG